MKPYVKKIISIFTSNKALFNLFFSKNKIVVFVFHDTSPTPSPFSKNNDLNSTPDDFKTQIRLIQENFEIISIKEIRTAHFSNKPKAIITFDDGYRSLFDWAFQWLEENQIPATLFVSGEAFTSNKLTSAQIDYLTRSEKTFQSYLNEILPKKPIEFSFLNITPQMLNNYLIKNSASINLQESEKYFGNNLTIRDLDKFSNSNYITFGNHLFSHFCLNTLSNSEIKYYINENQKILTKYPNFTKAFSATFGIISEKSLNTLKELDLELIFTENNLFFEINDLYLSKTNYNLCRLAIPTNLRDKYQFYFILNTTAIRRIFKTIKYYLSR